MHLIALYYKFRRSFSFVNDEFRIKWPRGEMGALPDDAKQDLRIEYLQRDVEKLQNIIEEIEKKNK